MNPHSSQEYAIASEPSFQGLEGRDPVQEDPLRAAAHRTPAVLVGDLPPHASALSRWPPRLSLPSSGGGAGILREAADDEGREEQQPRLDRARSST